MKQLALLCALLILLAPMPTRAGGDCKPPPSPPDSNLPLCSAFGWPGAFPFEFDPTTPPAPSVWDPNNPVAQPPPCPEGSQPWECVTANPATIDQQPLPIHVEGGVPPFRWELIESPGFSLEFSTTADHNNILRSNSACGTATIRVTDACARGPQTTEGYVKSVRGQWNEIVPAYCAIPGPPDFMIGSPAAEIPGAVKIAGKYMQIQYWQPLGSRKSCVPEFYPPYCDPEFGCNECLQINLVESYYGEDTFHNKQYWKKESSCCYHYSGNPLSITDTFFHFCVHTLLLLEWGCLP